MGNFVAILKQFTPGQRLVVLLLLLAFTSGTYLAGAWMKTDDCRPLIEENLRMHSDFARVSAMLRQSQGRSAHRIEREEYASVALDSAVAVVMELRPLMSDKSARAPASADPGPSVIDQVLKITDSHAR